MKPGESKNGHFGEFPGGLLVRTWLGALTITAQVQSLVWEPKSHIKLLQAAAKKTHTKLLQAGTKKTPENNNKKKKRKKERELSIFPIIFGNSNTEEIILDSLPSPANAGILISMLISCNADP